jgi:hypothetical protein
MTMIMMKPACACLLSAGLLNAWTAWAEQGDSSFTKGPDTELFGETISSEYELDGASRLVSVRLTLPNGVIQKAMKQPAIAHTIDLPEALKSSSLVQNITIDWNPEGHEPADVYDVPHFDFHFYFISKESVSSIDCTDRTPIPAALVLEGYVLPPMDAPGACVPKMGYHAVPLKDLGPDQVFVETPIYGYYQGQLIFFEPMITHEHLMSGHAVEHDITYPKAFLTTVENKFVPTHYRMHFDPQIQAYRLTLSKRSQD